MSATAKNPEPADGRGLEARLVATIGPVMRHLLSHARRRPAWLEMTYQQYNVLRIVQEHAPVGQAEVARRLMVSPPVVTRLAAALEEAGLLARREDPDDRRAVRLTLTAAGRKRVDAMRRELLDAAGELLEPLPEGERDAVADALDRLQVLLPDRRPAEQHRRG